MQETAHEQQSKGCDPVSENAPPHWRKLVRHIIHAGQTHTVKQMIDEGCRQKSLEGVITERKGKMLKCHVPYDIPDVQPGEKVKVISGSNSRGYTGGRYGKYSGSAGQSGSSVLDAVVKSSDAFSRIVLLESESVGNFNNGQRVKIMPVPNGRGLTDEMESYETHAKRLDIMSDPFRRFFKGDFKTEHEGELESKEGLDSAQNKAYGMAMFYDKCPVLFLHGGPGTGKTKTVCEIIKGHIGKERRVLVLSHSNKGSQVPAMKLKKEQVETNSGGKIKKHNVKVHVAGNHPETVDPKLHKDRIKRGVNFPRERLRRIKEMADEDVSREVLIMNYGSHKSDDIKRGKKLLERIALDEYAKKFEKAKQRFCKSMEKGGVAFSTLGTLVNDRILTEFYFDVVIVDEATRLRTPHLIRSLAKAGQQIIFVGDPIQLGNIPITPDDRNAIIESLHGENDYPPKPISDLLFIDDESSVLKSRFSFSNRLEQAREMRKALFGVLGFKYDEDEAKKAVRTYDEGPFASAILKSHDPEKELPYVFLDQNRRSLPNIVHVLSDLMYAGRLQPGRTPKENEGDGIVRFINTSGLESVEKTVGTSRKNTMEAKIIAERVLDKVIREKVSPEEIGVIATYGAQARLIRKYLKRKLWNSDKNKDLYQKLELNIDSVDAFQGDERKIVFVSLTRSNEEGNIGFLEEQRRIGVAIGRAQDELYVVGDMRTIADQNNVPESKAFFTRMRDSIAKYGAIESEPYRPYRKRKRRRKKKNS
jgi:hypothetical protein